MITQIRNECGVTGSGSREGYHQNWLSLGRLDLLAESAPVRYKLASMKADVAWYRGSFADSSAILISLL
jgi:hypothetical protein